MIKVGGNVATISIKISPIGLNVMYLYFPDMPLTNPFHTSQKAYSVSITNTNRLLLYREVIVVHCCNNIKSVYAGYDIAFLNRTASGTYH
jgi:hypothetical protein